MKAWRTLSRQVLLERAPYLRVEEHTVELPDGQVIADWPWLVLPDFAIVIAVTEEGAFLCFRQTKYAVEGPVLAPIGGYLEPEEAPLPAAKRELLEETGYAAPAWHDLGHFAVDGNRGAGTAHLFLALDARRVGEPNADDLEEQELLLLTRAEVEAAVRAGSFKVLPWATAFSLALLRLSGSALASGS
ncbi:MAG: NUDIX hydrolase [Anaerolineales bacterium]